MARMPPLRPSARRPRRRTLCAPRGSQRRSGLSSAIQISVLPSRRAVNQENGDTVGSFTHAPLATSTLRRTCILPSLSSDLQGLRTSQRGPCASRHVTVLPTTADASFSPARFRTLLLVRVHLPLHLDDSKCRCGAPLDPYGHHRSACATVGLLAPRGAPAEVAARRICREAGVRVRQDQLLRDLNVAVPAGDTRKIEVIANGLPLWGGKQLAIDTTVVSALTGRGRARGRAPGVALAQARGRKEARYPELVDPASRCKLVVLGLEVGGRWSEEAVSFVQLLARHRAQECPRLLRRSAVQLFFNRWTGLLACAVQQAFAASLLGEPLPGTACVNGPAVRVADLDQPL